MPCAWRWRRPLPRCMRLADAETGAAAGRTRAGLPTSCCTLEGTTRSKVDGSVTSASGIRVHSAEIDGATLKVVFDTPLITGAVNTGELAYDLAVCLNAWCFEADGALNVTKARLLLGHYGKVRPIGTAELEALPILARGSAIRFLLTRLYDWLNVPEGALVKPKDPLEYWRRLRFHQRVEGPSAYGLA